MIRVIGENFKKKSGEKQELIQLFQRIGINMGSDMSKK